MGNHQQHQQIQSRINSFEVIQKGSHFNVLRDVEGKEYVKFLYAMVEDEGSGFTEAKDVRGGSIFNKGYLKYRFELQNSHERMDMLPKIILFGQQTQGGGIISCSKNKINFVVFQHPYKRSLKHQVENRIATGTTFEEHQLFKLIKSVCEGLSQYFQHIKDWNQQILERKTFVITQENIFIKTNEEFIVSDIISQLNHIEQISKQQVTLCKSRKSTSMTNLHAKMPVKKLKQKFFQSNFGHLAQIIESIIFKFQCFSQSTKNSHESQSLSTALQSYRGLSKNPNNCSREMDKILKELRQPFVSENQIINSIERILSSIHLPTPVQSSIDFSSLLEKKVSVQQSTIKLFGETKKLSEVNQFHASRGRQPLCELTQIHNQEVSRQSNKIHETLISKRFSHNFPQNDSEMSEQKFSKKSKSKLRLSLKKDLQISKQLKGNIGQVQDPLKRKFSQPKFIAHKSNNNTNQTNKQNCQISFKIHSIGFPQTTTKDVQTTNQSHKPTQNILKSKLGQLNRIKDTCDKQKKKVFLKKPIKDELINSCENQIKTQHQQSSSSTYHLNPMSRKKNLGISKVLPLMKENKENVPVFKTIEKAKNQLDLDLIDNLSSIMSNNQNNTLSSYGIPTEEFKTENSLIEQEGCIGFNQVVEIDNGKTKLKETRSKTQKGANEIELPNSPCKRLSSYPSIELMESITQKSKIPEFLKKFKLPEKHLVALNNIILTQKNVIFEQSFQQSDFNSIRHSVPNILCLQQDFSQLKNKRNSKVILNRIDELAKNGANKRIDGEYKLEDESQVLSFEVEVSRQFCQLQRYKEIEKSSSQVIQIPFTNY